VIRQRQLPGLGHRNHQAERSLSTLAADATGELDVLGHDGDTLGVDGAEVDILEKADEIGLSSLLQCKNGG